MKTLIIITRTISILSDGYYLDESNNIMYKEQLLEELSNKLRTGEITKEEVLRQVNSAPGAASLSDGGFSSKITANNILYVLGAIIVIVGIVFFFAQVWG